MSQFNDTQDAPATPVKSSMIWTLARGLVYLSLVIVASALLVGTVSPEALAFAAPYIPSSMVELIGTPKPAMTKCSRSFEPEGACSAEACSLEKGESACCGSASLADSSDSAAPMTTEADFFVGTSSDHSTCSATSTCSESACSGACPASYAEVESTPSEESLSEVASSESSSGVTNE